MKIIGVLIILGALIVGGVAIQGYVDAKDHLAWARGEATKVEAKLKAVATEPSPVEGASGHARVEADTASFVLRVAQENLQSHRNESLAYGGGAAVAFALGVVLFRRSRRKNTAPLQLAGA